MKRAVLFTVCLHVLTLPALSQEADFTGKCVAIADGDTISVMHLGREERIRLHGIDCPEKTQAFGTKAKKFTGDLAFGKQVTVQVKDKDRYGRTVGVVILPDGRNLNYELLRVGFAWWYKQYAPNEPILKALEDQAKQYRRGLWADAEPVPPWDFRHNRPTVQESATETETTIDSESEEQIVYITSTGSKYHRDTCQHLRKSKIATTLEKAKASGYTPCSRCSPPR